MTTMTMTMTAHPCCDQLECPECRRFSKSQHAIQVDEWIDRGPEDIE